LKSAYQGNSLAAYPTSRGVLRERRTSNGSLLPGEVLLGELTPVSSFVHGGLKVNKDYYNETIKMDGEEYEKGITLIE
jgi:hypothetical protein